MRLVACIRISGLVLSKNATPQHELRHLFKKKSLKHNIFGGIAELCQNKYNLIPAEDKSLKK